MPLDAAVTERMIPIGGSSYWWTALSEWDEATSSVFGIKETFRLQRKKTTSNDNKKNTHVEKAAE